MEDIYDKETDAMIHFLSRSRTEMQLTANMISKQQEADRMETERLALQSRQSMMMGNQRDRTFSETVNRKKHTPRMSESVSMPSISRMSTISGRNTAWSSDTLSFEKETSSVTSNEKDPRQRWKEKKAAIRKKQLEQEVVEQMKQRKQVREFLATPRPPTRNGTLPNIKDKPPNMSRQMTLLSRESSMVLPGTPEVWKKKTDDDVDLEKEFAEEKEAILRNMQVHESKVQNERARQSQIVQMMKEKRKAKKEEEAQKATELLQQADDVEKTQTEGKNRQWNKLKEKLEEKKKRKKKKKEEKQKKKQLEASADDDIDNEEVKANGEASNKDEQRIDDILDELDQAIQESPEAEKSKKKRKKSKKDKEKKKKKKDKNKEFEQEENVESEA
ncbi:DgyrCDS1525 [Dimorphilus gyrociliatus]|nr:DgyrCDS1525 [Dimorphilus gyrociliatus]